MRLSCLILAAAGLAIGLGVGGCALRATTDFGPGDDTAHRSVGAGVGPFPNIFNSQGGSGGHPDAAQGADGGPESGGWH